MVFLFAFVKPVVPTNVVGTKIYIYSLKIGEFNLKVFLGGNEPKNIIKGDMATFTERAYCSIQLV